MTDEDMPTPRPHRLVAHPLGAWDVAELREYIEELRAEIARVEAAVARKLDHRTAAEAFFKSGPR
jgi:uncharacterized small protein (DUF1192 family)